MPPRKANTQSRTPRQNQSKSKPKQQPQEKQEPEKEAESQSQQLKQEETPKRVSSHSSPSKPKSPSLNGSATHEANNSNFNKTDNNDAPAEERTEAVVTLKKDKVILNAENAKAKSDIFSLQNQILVLTRNNESLTKVVQPLAGFLDDAPAKLVSDEEFAKYEKIRSLGHTEFATVAEVKYKSGLSSLSSPSSLSSNEQPTRFARKSLIFKKFGIDEFKKYVKDNKALLNLRHPCIASVCGFSYPSGERPPSLFLEFLPNKLSEDLISQMTATRKALVVTEIALGLRFVHSLGFVHRELKPANILMTDTMHVKICDIQVTVLDTLEAQLAKGVGAAQFMSPQLLAEESFTSKADVYSFGMLLFFVVCGYYPKLSVRDRAVGKPIEIPGVFLPFVGEIVSRCLAFEEAKRPSFVEIIEKFRENNFEIVDGMDTAFVIERVNFVEAYERIHGLSK